ERAKDETLQNEPEQDARNQRDREADDQGDMISDMRRTESEGPKKQRAEDQDLPLRQIHDPRGAVDDHERDRNEAVDQPDQCSFNKRLQEVDHCCSSIRLRTTDARKVPTVPS